MTAPAPRNRKEKFELEQHRIYEIALHDVRRAIDTLAPDDHLIGHIYRRLARAVSEAYGLASPFHDELT